MSTSFSAIRTAIEAEIKSLSAQLKKLENVLRQLDGDAPSTPTIGKRRGRKPKSEKAASSAADLSKALELLKEAGKSGIKAIKLSYLLRGAGHSKVGKMELLGTDQVKMTGKGGASTYVFTA